MTLSLAVRPVGLFEPSDALRSQLVRRATTLCRGKFDPEDLVQEVLTSNLAWLRSAGGLPEQAVLARLYRSLTNAFISRLRHADASDRYARAAPVEEPAVPSPEDAPELERWEQVTDEEMQEAMACLSAKQREVFLAVTAGERYASIGERLGLSANAVGKRAFDARQRLRQKLLELIGRRGS